MYILIPDIYLFFHHQNFHLILMSLFVLIYLYSIFKSTKYLFVFFPFFVLIAPYFYYISIYKTAINEQVLSIILETNIQEAGGFLGGSFFLYIFICILWCVFCFYIVLKHYKKPIVWKHWSRILIFILGTLYFSIGYYLNEKIAKEMTNAFGSNSNFLVEESNSFLLELKQTYPLGLLISGWDMFKEQKKINKAYDKNKNFNFGATRLSIKDKKEIYVLILGETSRRENWQLNGYKRNTNPKLSKQENLVNFTNIISVSNATRASLPIMLTRKPDKNVNKYDFPEKSIISAFKEVGFKTYWLSTQQKFGAFDTSTSVYAKEADEIHFLNKTGYTQAGEHDDVLIPLFNKIIRDKEQKQFIIIHTLGSHYDYEHRYPIEFKKYTPSLSSLKNYSLQEYRNKFELLNSYDNSILFTDYVINEFIQILKQQEHALSFLIYSSDHGEDLFDKRCMMSGHGLETARNFEIASFAWYSDSFESKFSEKVDYLKMNQHRKMNQTLIFPTLVDAANISIKNELLERSVLRSFVDYPRLIMGGRNYDKSKFIGDCREIK